MEAGRKRRKDTEVIRKDGKVDKKASYYTFCVRFPKAWEQDLKDVVFDDRYEGGITEYINELVRRDLAKRKQKHATQFDSLKAMEQIRDIVREYEQSIL